MDTIPKHRSRVKPTSRPASKAVDKRGGTKSKPSTTPHSIPTLLAMPPPPTTTYSIPTVHPPSNRPPAAASWPSWVGGRVSHQLESLYEFGEQLGRPGAYGYALLATHRQTKQRVAIKVVDKTQLCREDLEALSSELSVMAQVSHPCVASLMDSAESPTHVRMVMQACYGGELLDRLTVSGVFSEALTRTVAAQLLWGMADLHHAGIAHCDLKPDNILFRAPSDTTAAAPAAASPYPYLPVPATDAITVIDFGLAKYCSPGACFREVTGTPYYIAPEVLQGQYSLHCDMWGVGVLVFIMFFGFAPFDADDLDSPLIRQQLEAGFTPSVRPGRGPWFPQEHPISPSAMHLVTHLLDRDIALRLTAAEALSHPFITGTGINAALDMLTMLLPYLNAHPALQAVADAVVNVSAVRQHVAAAAAAVRELLTAAGRPSGSALDSAALERLRGRAPMSVRGQVDRLLAAARFQQHLDTIWTQIGPGAGISSPVSVPGLAVDDWTRAVSVWWICGKAERIAGAFGTIVRAFSSKTAPAPAGTVIMQNGPPPAPTSCSSLVALGTGVCVDAVAINTVLAGPRLDIIRMRPNAHALGLLLRGTAPSAVDLTRDWLAQGAMRHHRFLTQPGPAPARGASSTDPLHGYFASFFKRGPMPPPLPLCPLGNACPNAAPAPCVRVALHHATGASNTVSVDAASPLCMHVCVTEAQFIFSLGYPHLYNTVLPAPAPAIVTDHSKHQLPGAVTWDLVRDKELELAQAVAAAQEEKEALARAEAAAEAAAAQAPVHAKPEAASEPEPEAEPVSEYIPSSPAAHIRISESSVAPSADVEEDINPEEEEHIRLRVRASQVVDMPEVAEAVESADMYGESGAGDGVAGGGDGDSYGSDFDDDEPVSDIEVMQDNESNPSAPRARRRSRAPTRKRHTPPRAARADGPTTVPEELRDKPAAPPATFKDNGENFDFALGAMDLEETEAARVAREARERRKAEKVAKEREEEEKRRKAVAERERREEKEWREKQKEEKEREIKRKEEEWKARLQQQQQQRTTSPKDSTSPASSSSTSAAPADASRPLSQRGDLSAREQAVLRMRAELAALRQEQERAIDEREPSEDESNPALTQRRRSVVEELREKRRRDAEERAAADEARLAAEREERERREREVMERRAQRLRAQKEKEKKELARQERIRVLQEQEKSKERDRRRAMRPAGSHPTGTGPNRRDRPHQQSTATLVVLGPNTSAVKLAPLPTRAPAPTPTTVKPLRSRSNPAQNTRTRLRRPQHPPVRPPASSPPPPNSTRALPVVDLLSAGLPFAPISTNPYQRVHPLQDTSVSPRPSPRRQRNTREYPQVSHVSPPARMGASSRTRPPFNVSAAVAAPREFPPPPPVPSKDGMIHSAYMQRLPALPGTRKIRPAW